MARVLVVDDKESMRDSVTTTLARRGHAAVACASGRQAVEKAKERTPDAIVTDLQMPEMNGLELLEEIRRIDEQIPVIVMTAFGTVDTAVHAMKLGAFDYVTKPFSGDELAIAVDRAIEHGRVVKENQILRASASPAGRTPSGDMVGTGPTMRELRERIGRIAASHGTVLVSGESGTGKEVAARLIHASSPRAQQPFLALNCAALSANLLESELFGHEKGAFTGADRLRKGRFELADGGTLLLDEISEIPPELQAKLLRVLQERTFERVGSSQSRTVDVRVIATTNRDLAGEVDRGRFRGDLYFRLNVLPIEMPPLRDRPEDIPELARHFLGLVAAREGKPSRRLDPDAVELLRAYPWPGNVRELQNICERAAVLASDDRITAALVGPWLGGGDAGARPVPSYGAERASRNGGVASAIAATSEREVVVVETGFVSVEPRVARNGTAPSAGPAATDAASIACDGTYTLADVEREITLATLERNGGHRVKSARDLGIGVRTLGLKIKKWKEEGRIPQSV